MNLSTLLLRRRMMMQSVEQDVQDYGRIPQVYDIGLYDAVTKMRIYVAQGNYSAANYDTTRYTPFCIVVRAQSEGIVGLGLSLVLMDRTNPDIGTTSASDGGLIAPQEYDLIGTTMDDGDYNTDLYVARNTMNPNWKTDYEILDGYRLNVYSNGYCAPALCCRRFTTLGIKQGKWYWPSYTELLNTQNLRFGIRKSMTNVYNAGFPAWKEYIGDIITSSQNTQDKRYQMNVDVGGSDISALKKSRQRVVAFCKLPNVLPI